MSQVYMAFDCETGGLNAKDSDILTLYIGMMDENFKILEELDLKLKPDSGFVRAEPGALKVNKIDLQAHQSDPSTITYSAAKEKIVTMLKRHLKKSGKFSNIRPLGYNVDFDIKFVQQHILPEDEWNAIVHYVKVDPKAYVDLFKYSGWWPRDLGTLVSVVEFLQIPMRGAHNAKEDTLMTVEVYRKIVDLMRSKKENGSTQDIISLLEAE